MDIDENHRTPLLAEVHNNGGPMPLEPKMKAISGSEGGEIVLDINEVSCSNVNGHDIDNPFAFLGFSDDFNVPASSIDPFRNHTPNISGVYEWIKTVICVPLALVRVLVFGVVLSIGFLACKLALIGWKDRQSPMPKWRGALMWVGRIAARWVLFCFGYHWIRRIGKPASRRIAPIVVCNHVSYTDPLFFFYELFPSIVASETHDKIPVVGTIIRTTQVIYVDRSSPESRKHAVAEIKRKASCNDFPRVMLFPEGTTTNGKALISFQTGAFVPGFPVQPVVIRYPHVHFDPSWGKTSLSKLIFRMLTQFHNFMEVEYLPVIFPTESKMGNPAFYARKVGYAMAKAINVVQTEHSYGDLILASRASHIGLVPPSAYVVEMAKMERLFELSTREAIVFLERFAAMHPDSSGCVNMDNFLAGLGFPRTPFSEQIFCFYDVESQGSITFSEYLGGSMCIRKRPKFPLVCELAFKYCDIEGNHVLLIEQVERTLKLVFPCISVDNVYQIFKLFDVDSDEAVSWDDFRMCLERNPVFISLFCVLIEKNGFSHP